MISRVVKVVKLAGVTGSIVVVVGDDQKNPYAGQIREALCGHTDLKFAVQPNRYGAADAVARGIAQLNGERHILVSFADMPLWRPGTLKQLVESHLRSCAIVSMVTLHPPEGHRTERYGRIAYDSHGGILAAFEPSELKPGQLKGAVSVNPSLYVFERGWFEANWRQIPPVSKQDGFPSEYHLPKLLPIAHGQGICINHVDLEDPGEALGVNTAEELAEVREVISRRNGSY
jgi:bifunctional N-acetylglucosamine-1-phosphate-uridyltransferase/glucosamine-1-phosphate-acetyltransferase GlmU-like protein